MINLRKDHLEIIKEILRHHVPNINVVAFGSRVNGNPKEHSDMDLAIIGNKALEIKTIARLKEALSESKLTIKVDVLDWATISAEFRKKIEQDCEVIQKSFA